MMIRLGLTIGSFAPAVGLPGRARQFAKVADWMNQLRQEHGYWLQGFPLRGCLDTEVKFNSIEGPWCGLARNTSGWHFQAERYRSLSHRLQAQVVLRLYDSPDNIAWWMSEQQGSAVLIVNTLAELRQRSTQTCQTWLELNANMGCTIDELIDTLDEHDVPGTFSYRVVYDTLHAGEITPVPTDAQLKALGRHIKLIHWQPQRTLGPGGRSEFGELLWGRATAAVDDIRRIRNLLPHRDEVPIVLEPSLHHWRQIGGQLGCLSVEWIKSRLLECLEILNGHLG